jgi:DNA repair exonuclease SbcCD ATPase subunit
MRLLKFKANNLFSLGDVEIDLDKRGLVLITGHSLDEGGANGSGKSSLSNKGVLWTLFGSTASGERADAAINKFAPADSTCCGLLDVESNSGGQFRIVRSRNPNRLSVSDLATGADISAKTEKETQVLINTILGRTRESFLQTDFFGQGKLAAFLDLTPKAQVELLETILPFDRLAELADKARDFLSKIDMIHSSVERKISEHTGKLLEAQRQERVLSDAIDTWDKDHLEKKSILEARIAEIEAGDFEALKQRAVELPNMVECTRAETEVKDYLKTLDSIEYAARAAMDSRHRAMAKLTPPAKPSNNSQTCPTCTQPIGFIVHAAIEREFQNWQKQYATLQHEIKLEETTLLDVHNCRKEAIEKQEEIAHNIKMVREFEAECAKRNSGELAILRQNLEDTLAEVNPYDAMYTQTQSTMNMVIQTLSMHKARLDQIDKDEQALAFWRDAFGKELKNEFISQVCPFIQERCNRHLDGLANSQIKVLVGTRKHLKSSEDRSEFTITASSITGSGSYDSLSGGERQLVSFAMGLALADLVELQTDGPSYFMVLDEPFMALDARNSENLVNYLNTYLQGKKETILLVSNEETLKSLIPNRINVIKENGVSRIE